MATEKPDRLDKLCIQLQRELVGRVRRLGVDGTLICRDEIVGGALDKVANVLGTGTAYLRDKDQNAVSDALALAFLADMMQRLDGADFYRMLSNAHMAIAFMNEERERCMAEGIERE